jgi:hypothetical protein
MFKIVLAVLTMESTGESDYTFIILRRSKSMNLDISSLSLNTLLGTMLNSLLPWYSRKNSPVSK